MDGLSRKSDLQVEQGIEILQRIQARANVNQTLRNGDRDEQRDKSTEDFVVDVVFCIRHCPSGACVPG